MSATAPSTDNSAWIRRFHPAPDARSRLVCFPHAGGSASYFFPVSRAMAPAVDVLAVQYPGRQDRRHEPCVDDLNVLADLVVPQLEPWLDRPLTLFGHSMGATLAFEVARRLHEAGTRTLGLFVSGRCAPTRHRVERMHLADDRRLLAGLGTMSGTDPAVLGDDEILRAILPALRSDYRAAETYRYSPRTAAAGPDLDCPIVALVGNSDEQVTPQEARSWAERTTGPFALQVFNGGHFYLIEHAGAVITAIRRHIAAQTVISA